MVALGHETRPQTRPTKKKTSMQLLCERPKRSDAVGRLQFAVAEVDDAAEEKKSSDQTADVSWTTMLVAIAVNHAKDCEQGQGCSLILEEELVVNVLEGLAGIVRRSISPSHVLYCTVLYYTY